MRNAPRASSASRPKLRFCWGVAWGLRAIVFSDTLLQLARIAASRAMETIPRTSWIRLVATGDMAVLISSFPRLGRAPNDGVRNDTATVWGVRPIAGVWSGRTLATRRLREARQSRVGSVGPMARRDRGLSSASVSDIRVRDDPPQAFRLGCSPHRNRRFEGPAFSEWTARAKRLETQVVSTPFSLGDVKKVVMARLQKGRSPSCEN